jgi:predicted adenine nucleotide alpha hydrolase (AANH) superfamily ATPase
MRLERTAREAAERGFDAITTTLLGSEQQKHSLVRSLGETCAAESGVEFLYRDWRPVAQSGHERARSLNLYMQSYCGCIFSESERYRDTSRHLYRGPGPMQECPPR